MAKELDLREVAQDVKEYDRIIYGQASNEEMAGICEELAALCRIDGDCEGSAVYLARAANFRYCHHRMFFNYYRQQGIKDFQWTFHCNDRFCGLCTKDKANSREFKFNKILDLVYEEYDLFHLTLTLRNCLGNTMPRALLSEKYRELSTLSADVRQMSKRFQLLNRYMSGHAKIRGIDFGQYGYGGAIRSLEITYDNIPLYHPHYHIILALRKGVELPGENYNDFSWDMYTRKVTPFSDFEILIQKIWFLILNRKDNERICKDFIDKLEQGYSCRMRRLEPDDYHQTFKYAIKPGKNAGMDINVFQDLDAALFNMRTVQCYGCFHGLHLSDEEIDDENDVLYDELIQMLNAVEKPVECSESPSDVRDNIKKQQAVYISRRRVRAFIRKYGLEDELSFIIAEPERVKQFAQMMFDMPAVTMPGLLAAFDGKRDVKISGA